MKYNLSDSAWCSCRDNSTRGLKCKHQFAIEFAIRMGTLKDTDKLPGDENRDTFSVLLLNPEPIAAGVPTKPSSYREDDYSFWLLSIFSKKRWL